MNMKHLLYMLLLSGILGIMACHSDVRSASDVNADLLTNPSNSTAAIPTTIQGTVSCTGCEAGGGMAVVIDSVLSGIVANQHYDTLGSYSLLANIKPGDVLDIKVSVIKSSGPVMRSAVITVSADAGTIQQDFKF